MSTINFSTFVDLPNSATPSSGYTVAYDLDGVLKQKDQYGVVTPIGLQTQTLEEVLAAGNESGAYSILIGTSSYIGSQNGGGQILFDYGNPSTLFLSTDSGSAGESYLSLGTNSIALYSNIGDALVYAKENLSISGKGTVYIDSSNIISIVSDDSISNNGFINVLPDQIKIGLNDLVFLTSNDESIVIYNTSTQSHTTTGNSKWPVIIGSKNATVNSSVINSVIIGGNGLTASSSDTVYLGPVNINNAYNLPTTDGTSGYVLKTDGAGNVTWGLDSAFQSLSDVLSYGNSTEVSNIIMGTSTYVGSINNFNIVTFDNGLLLSTDSGLLVDTYVQLDSGFATVSTSTFSVTIDHSEITTSDLEGLKYSTDYSASFVTYSLVDKGYVDSIIKPLNSYSTAFVDISYGNDSTGQINKFDRPYQTVAAAINGLTSSVSSGTVYIRRGFYTELINIENNFNYYCEPGVVFTDGGFRDYQDCTSKILGYACFEGTLATLRPLTILSDSNIDFEFDKCDNTNYFARIEGNMTVNIRGNYIYSRCDNGYCIRVKNSGTTNIKVTEKILGAYITISVFKLNGHLYIDCPEIQTNTDLGLYGYVSGNSVTLLSTDDSIYGVYEIKGNLSNISSDYLYTFLNPDSPTRYDSAVAVFAGYGKFNGDIDGGYTKGLYVGYPGNISPNGDIRVKGNIYSWRESLITNDLSTYISEGTLRSYGSGSYAGSVNIIGTPSNVYIKDSIIYNTRTDSSQVYLLSDISTVGIYNTLGYSNGTGGNFIYTTQSVSVGLHSVRSNKDNVALVTDLFAPSGFIYDTGLFIPNF